MLDMFRDSWRANRIFQGKRNHIKYRGGVRALQKKTKSFLVATANFSNKKLSLICRRDTSSRNVKPNSYDITHHCIDFKFYWAMSIASINSQIFLTETNKIDLRARDFGWKFKKNSTGDFSIKFTIFYLFWGWILNS